MTRRRFLAAGAAGALAATAGCLSLVYPTVEGRAVRKAVRGGAVGDRSPLATETADGVSVRAEGLRDSFPVPLRVDDALAARLRERYGEVTYTLTVALSTPDPVNGFEAGEEAIYVANRPPWNAVAAGAAVRGRVARFDGGPPRLASVEPA